jgi:hypothetical protein
VALEDPAWVRPDLSTSCKAGTPCSTGLRWYVLPTSDARRPLETELARQLLRHLIRIPWKNRCGLPHTVVNLTLLALCTVAMPLLAHLRPEVSGLSTLVMSPIWLTSSLQPSAGDVLNEDAAQTGSVRAQPS